MPSKLSLYVAKKLAFFVVTLFIAISINFFIPRLMPGDPLAHMMGQMTSRPGGREQYEAFRKEFGLDKDLYTQYALYWVNLLKGHLGPAFSAYPANVEDIVMERLPWTIGLLSVTTVISWVIGNLLGGLVVWTGHKRLGLSMTVLAIVLNQVPFYIFALILIYLFAYIIPIFPLGSGYGVTVQVSFNWSYISSVLLHACLPALSIVLVSIGMWLLGMRAMMINIQESDYLRFAQAKGLKRNTILMKYAIRNTLLPQITALGMSLGFVMSGALLVEYVFGYPGVGMLFINAMNYRDYNLMQGVFFFTIVAVLAANLLIDLLYPFIDPRIRTAGEE